MCQILLVENNSNQRLLYVQELSEEGYHSIVTASNGAEGLDLFKQYQPKLTILDILLPGMDGIEVLEQILRIDPQAATIVHSAYSSPSHDFVTWYASAYVVKSGNLQELKRQVRRVLAAETAEQVDLVQANEPKHAHEEELR